MIELYIKLVAAIAPAVILAILMIRRDRMHPEPVRWMLGSAGLGIVAGIAVILIGLIVFKPVEIDSFLTAFYDAFVTAALPEEAMKLCMLSIIANRCRHFDEYFDGIVYAVCIGMGFAGFENIIYLFSEDEWLVMGILRALLAVPAHYFFAVIMGTFFALSYFDKRNGKLYKSMALLVPVVAHGLYDFLCFSIALDENLCFYILVAFFVCFKWISKYSKRLMRSMLKLDEYGTTD